MTRVILSSIWKKMPVKFWVLLNRDPRKPPNMHKDFFRSDISIE